MTLFFLQVQLEPGMRACFLFEDAIIRFPYVNLIILYNVTRTHFAQIPRTRYNVPFSSMRSVHLCKLPYLRDT